VSFYRHYDGRNPIGFQLTVHGDGTKAHLVDPGSSDNSAGTAEYDFAGLAAVMLDLISRQTR
jgi:hypothetical protein